MHLAVAGRKYSALLVEGRCLVKYGSIICFGIQGRIVKTGIPTLFLPGISSGMDKKYIGQGIRTVFFKDPRQAVGWIFFPGMGCPVFHTAIIRTARWQSIICPVAFIDRRAG